MYESPVAQLVKWLLQARHGVGSTNERVTSVIPNNHMTLPESVPQVCENDCENTVQPYLYRDRYDQNREPIPGHGRDPSMGRTPIPLLKTLGTSTKPALSWDDLVLTNTREDGGGPLRTF